jgi:hypothetical protein
MEKEREKSISSCGSAQNANKNSALIKPLSPSHMPLILKGFFFQ